MSALGPERITQIGVVGEERLVPDFRTNLPLWELRDLLTSSLTFVCVDSFLPHLARHVARRGVVVWSVSDPVIFGYPENINLLKDRSFLRTNQFGLWEEQPYNEDAFVDSSLIVDAVRSLGG